MVRVGNTPGVVSEEFSLGPGSYVVIGKLYLAFQSGMAFSTACELRQGDETLDVAGVVLVAGRQIPLTLVSTTTVENPSDDFTIVCRTDSAAAVANALAIQLVGISVDKVSGP
jgi:hypothetical protein